jgi:NAD(P)-dependent dehydrogenase (short-subunit alcohol dehydrogenase family)
MAEWTGVAGKRVLMTGATRGIGLAAAKELARRGAQLAIVARSPERASAAVAEIGEAAPGAPQVDVLSADLTSLHSVRLLANEALERYPRIDVLVNNAGAVFSRRELTAEGLERTWALNHLAPFLLTNTLLERLKESAPARVITTASDAHKGMRIPFDDLNAERSYRMNGFVRYGQTKLANILFTVELARRTEGSGVSAYCVHPGVVATGFNRNNGTLMNLGMLALKPFIRSPERGARTLVWLADTPDHDPPTLADGGYFVDERAQAPSGAALDLDAARRLWEVSEEQISRVLAAAAGG